MTSNIYFWGGTVSSLENQAEKAQCRQIEGDLNLEGVSVLYLVGIFCLIHSSVPVVCLGSYERGIRQRER